MLSSFTLTGPILSFMESRLESPSWSAPASCLTCSPVTRTKSEGVGARVGLVVGCSVGTWRKETDAVSAAHAYHGPTPYAECLPMCGPDSRSWAFASVRPWAPWAGAWGSRSGSWWARGRNRTAQSTKKPSITPAAKPCRRRDDRRYKRVRARKRAPPTYLTHLPLLQAANLTRLPTRVGVAVGAVGSSVGDVVGDLVGCSGRGIRHELVQHRQSSAA